MANTLNDTIEGMIPTFEADRKKAHHSYVVLTAIGIPFIVGGILLFLLTFLLQWSQDIMNPIALAVILAGAVLCIVAGFVRRNYRNSVFSNLYSAVINTLFPKRVEDAHGGLPLKTILAPGFFATPDRYVYSDLLTSTYDNIPFEQAKYNLQRKETHTDSKGHTYTTYETYASGTMYHFTYERNFGQIVKVMEKSGLLAFGRGGLTKVETEYIAFNNKFAVLASDETTVFYLLTPQIQEKILSLESKFKGQFYMAFIGNQLYIAVNDSGSSIQIPWNEPLSMDNVAPVVECLAIPAVFIKLLGLNKAKFLKDAGTNPNDLGA